MPVKSLGTAGTRYNAEPACMGHALWNAGSGPWVPLNNDGLTNYTPTFCVNLFYVSMKSSTRCMKALRRTGQIRRT